MNTLATDLDSLRQQAHERFAPLRERRDALRETIIDQRAFPQALWDALAEGGYFGALIPEAYGGSGAGVSALSCGLEGMCTTGYGNALPVLTAMGTVAINNGGSEELKQSLLPEIAKGNLKIAVGFTEEESGFNLFNIKTRAAEHDGRYVIQGQKMYTSGADLADYILVLARTTSTDDLKAAGLPKTMGLSLFLVDAKAPGITRTEIPARGEGGVRTFVTEYNDVEVDAARCLGDPDQAALILFSIVNPERILFSAALLGLIEHSLTTACDFARERTVFRDTPIGQYQSIQHPLADIRMRLEAARLTTAQAAGQYDAGGDPMDVGFLANTAKYLTSELALQAVDQAIETLGGRGFDERYHLIHLWDSVRLFRTTPISPEMIRNFIAEQTLGLPRSY